MLLQLTGIMVTLICWERKKKFLIINMEMSKSLALAIFDDDCWLAWKIKRLSRANITWLYLQDNRSNIYMDSARTKKLSVSLQLLHSYLFIFFLGGGQRWEGGGSVRNDDDDDDGDILILMQFSWRWTKSQWRKNRWGRAISMAIKY